MKILKNILVSIMVVALAAAFTACSSTSAQTPADQAEEETTTVAETKAGQTEEQTEAEEKLKTLGTEDGAESEIIVVNNTGSDIVFFSLTTGESEAVNLLESGDVFAASEERTLYVPKAEGVDARSFPD